MSKSVKTKELFDCECPYLKEIFNKYEYPWEILPEISEYISLLSSGKLQGFTEVEKGVFTGQGVRISKMATIEPPAIIGDETEIRPGAYLRGNGITGRRCVIGNSSEIKNSIFYFL